jgi:hypothetical protein
VRQAGGGIALVYRGHGGQRAGVDYDRAALTQAICRQYAAAQRGMPYDTMYAQCMYARG